MQTDSSLATPVQVGPSRTGIDIFYPNVAPNFTSVVDSNQIVTVGDGLAALVANDYEGDAFAFAITAGSLPDGITLETDGTFTGTTTTPGYTEVTITVTDTHGASSSTHLDVTVN